MAFTVGYNLYQLLVNMNLSYFPVFEKFDFVVHSNAN